MGCLALELPVGLSEWEEAADHQRHEESEVLVLSPFVYSLPGCRVLGIHLWKLCSHNHGRRKGNEMGNMWTVFLLAKEELSTFASLGFMLEQLGGLWCL